MLAPEDDFGRVRAQEELPCRRRGACRPRPNIGTSLWDVAPEPPPSVRGPASKAAQVLEEGQLLGGVHRELGQETPRRLKKSVEDADGRILDASRPSSGRKRPEGIRQIDMMHVRTKAPLEGAKRCFDWTHGPTGPWNPKTYEEPPESGSRPSHPVSSQGVVALEHKRYFPEKQNVATAHVPPLRLKPESGVEMGGWGRDGAPGRKAHRGPWDSVLTHEGDEAQSYLADARRQKFPEFANRPTDHLTRWHLHPLHDVDPPMRRKVQLNVPMDAGGAGRGMASMPAAGRPTGVAIEGCRLSFYDRIREAEAGPRTAR